MTCIALCLFGLHLAAFPSSTGLLTPAARSLGAEPAQEAAPVAATHALPLPAGLAPTVAAKLAKGGVRVTLGKTVLSFWWVEALPAGAGSGGWAGVEEGTLVGALSVEGDFRDIRARIFKPGVYTLRYGIQPENGDHLGVSPFREFLLASPAALDSDPAPRGHDGTIEISKEAVGGSHPAVLSVDPPAAKQDVLQIHKTQLDHQSVVMEVPITRDGKPSGTLRFGVVVVGKIEA
jgi:hypothetical protein